jgi:ribosomal-protein-alanine N-acetyltransferase
MNLTISDMTPADLPEVMELEHGSFSTPWSAESFLAELEKGFSHVCVARDEDGSLVGFVCFWALYGEAHILNLAVRVDERRKGIGTAIAVDALRRASGQGAKSATLEVREKNIAAIRLYEGLGFVRAGLRRGYYEKPTDNAVIMRLHDIAEAVKGFC